MRTIVSNYIRKGSVFVDSPETRIHHPTTQRKGFKNLIPVMEDRKREHLAEEKTIEF